MRPASAFPSFEMRLQTTDAGVWLLKLMGELDALTANVFAGVAQAVPYDGPVEIDARDLTFCDSAGLGAIVRFAVSRSVRPVTLRDPCALLVRLFDDVDVSGVLDVRAPDSVPERLDELTARRSVVRGGSRRRRPDSAGVRMLLADIRAVSRQN
jgi:ABC-type transporter Mla MlaB component